MAHRFRTADKNTPAAQARAKQYASPEHRRTRAAWKRRIDSGDPIYCWRPTCRQRILPGSDWHLGHDDNDRRITRGPEHKTCNLHAAAQAGARASQPKRRGHTHSRRW